MRVLNKPISHRFRFISFYKDDIERMLAAIEASPQSYEFIRTERYEYTDSKDFFDSNSEPRPAHLFITTRAVDVYIDDSGLNITLSSFDNSDRGMFEVVSDQIRRLEKWHNPKRILTWASRILWANGLVWMLLNSFGGWPPQFVTPRVDTPIGVVNFASFMAGFVLMLARPGRTIIRLDINRSTSPWLERQWATFVAPLLIMLLGLVLAHYLPSAGAPGIDQAPSPGH